jgi:uncharacterized Zn-binding protein involved in type VI secretion
MGKPAARVVDKTSHGGLPLGPGKGSNKVMIGGMPPWRAIVDVHVCPLTTAAVAHGSGKVVKGSLKVFIDGMPAVRQGDTIIETGPPNMIAEGYPKVLIGD